MKDETRTWLKYAGENLQSAKLLLERSLYNPCLQNVQQTVEKVLKALLVESSLKVKKTHSINELKRTLDSVGIALDMTEDECDLLDSIYLPSKYPLGGILPDFEPDMEICERCIAIADRITTLAVKHLHEPNLDIYNHTL
jgi:HEPN domain-containing protein